MSISRRFSRRKLLSALGLTQASLFLPSLLGKQAVAQANDVRRIVIFTQHHGTVRENWQMRRGNPEGAFSYAFDDPDPASFSTVLQPLHPVRDQLLVLEGLSQASTLGDTATNNHNAGHLHLLTGAKMQSDESAGGPSVDQIIAREIARPDQIPSIEMATSNPWLGGFINSAAGARTPVETDPRKVFERIFPGGVVPNQEPQEPREPTEEELIRAAQGSLLDFVGGEYEAVTPRLSGEDRQKLEMHLQYVRDLEQRLIGGGDSAILESCGVPQRSFENLSTHMDRFQAYADLTAAAFACDQTRVATIQVTQLPTDEFGVPSGVDVHQDIAHETDNDALAAERMTQYNVVHAEMFKYLVDALARYGLLDTTLAVWISELATGPHDLDDIPVVMAGSAGGFLKTGQYISFAKNLPNPHEHPNWGPAAQRPIGPGHSHLMISWMQAMGLDRNSIGMESAVTRDGNNSTIDLTGPLSEIHV